MAVFGFFRRALDAALLYLSGRRTKSDFRCRTLFALASFCLGVSTVQAEYVVTEERFFNSAADAQTACQAQPVVYVCNPDGSMHYSYCSSIPQPAAGGITRVARVEWNKGADGGQCYYTYYANLRYTYFSSRDAGCPAGTTFVGPTANDCVSTTYTQTAGANQKGCGGGCSGAGSGSTGSPTPTSQTSSQASTNSSGSSTTDQADLVGNPINASIGNKTQREPDIQSGGIGVPTFVRTYNSFQSRELAGLGVGWTHNWARRLEVGLTINVIRGDGSSQQFTGSGLGLWSGDPDTKFRLEATSTGYTLSTQDGTVEKYNPLGLLISVQAPNGLITVVDQTPGYIVSVTGPFGHRLTFNWVGARLVSVQDPAGQVVGFTVDANNNLSVASYGNGTTRGYLYEASFLPHGLTGVIDGTGTRTSTYTYDSTTFLATKTERAGGVRSFQVTFSGLVGYIQDAVGRVVTQVRSRLFDLNKVTSASNNIDTKTVSTGYDLTGNVSTVTNEEGQTTLSATLIKPVFCADQ